MPTVHQAYQLHSLMKLTYQVESIAAYGDILLVGTRQGHLFMYTLEKKEPKCELTLMRQSKSFSKKPILQLEVIPEQDLLLSLSDCIVQLHDINALSLNTLDVIQKSKGATFFAINSEKVISTTGVTHYLVRLAIVVKRKIQLYFLKNNQFHSLCEDVSLTDIPKSMVWCQNVICLGYRDEYALLKLGNREDDNEHADLFPTSSAKAADPCILLISDSNFALCRENQTVLVNIEGQTEKNKSLKWSETPVYLAYDDPYTLGVLTDSVEVCSLDPCMTVQTLPEMPKVRFLVRAKQGILFAASLSQIWCIQMVDVGKQIECLLKAKEFQLALKLIQICDESDEEKRAKIHEIQTLLAYDLFSRKQFAESMKEFLKLGTDPQDVIRLYYPDMLPQTQQDDFTPTNKDWTDKEIQESIAALSDYLTAMRTFAQVRESKSSSGDLTKKSSKSSYQLLQIIDTVLVKCYLQTKDAMVAPILRQNFCHLAETEKILKKMKKYNDLIILYQTKGQHRKALELLQTEKSMEEESVEKTVKYLQKLGSENMALILQFSEWVLKKEPEKGLKIFTEDLPEVENLPRPRILDTLLKEHPDLAIPYLEHIIHNWKDDNPLFHNALIHQYREKITKDGPDNSEHTRKKLKSFLEKSTQYSAENVIKDFQTNSLLEEKALILGRLGKHDQAIALYVRALSDINKAKEYCARIYEKGGPDSQNVYAYLITLILKPDSFPLALPGVTLSPKTAQPDLELALQLLEENASKVNPLEILTTFPNDIPVSRIHQFLSVALHKGLQERRKEQLLKGLLYAEHLQLQETKLKLQGKHVLITEMNVCPVCKKRFSNQAALIWYPNGDVVHYSCHKDV
ncbi:vam6/Vps39-like protein [Euwallacea fornicatus]|uniref:vam6/Vps39-like protein n=1 Tax=Euwallacea fornicatus TaxID=995702 RepID=UPI00339037B5